MSLLMACLNQGIMVYIQRMKLAEEPWLLDRAVVPSALVSWLDSNETVLN